MTICHRVECPGPGLGLSWQLWGKLPSAMWISYCSWCNFRVYTQQLQHNMCVHVRVHVCMWGWGWPELQIQHHTLQTLWQFMMSLSADLIASHLTKRLVLCVLYVWIYGIFWLVFLQCINLLCNFTVCFEWLIFLECASLLFLLLQAEALSGLSGHWVKCSRDSNVIWIWII